MNIPLRVYLLLSILILAISAAFSRFAIPDRTDISESISLAQHKTGSYGSDVRKSTKNLSTYKDKVNSGDITDNTLNKYAKEITKLKILYDEFKEENVEKSLNEYIAHWNGVFNLEKYPQDDFNTKTSLLKYLLKYGDKVDFCAYKDIDVLNKELDNVYDKKAEHAYNILAKSIKEKIQNGNGLDLYFAYEQLEKYIYIDTPKTVYTKKYIERAKNELYAELSNAERLKKSFVSYIKNELPKTSKDELTDEEFKDSQKKLEELKSYISGAKMQSDELNSLVVEKEKSIYNVNALYWFNQVNALSTDVKYSSEIRKTYEKSLKFSSKYNDSHWKEKFQNLIKNKRMEMDRNLESFVEKKINNFSTSIHSLNKLTKDFNELECIVGHHYDSPYIKPPAKLIELTKSKKTSIIESMKKEAIVSFDKFKLDDRFTSENKLELQHRIVTRDMRNCIDFFNLDSSYSEKQKKLQEQLKELADKFYHDEIEQTLISNTEKGVVVSWKSLDNLKRYFENLKNAPLSEKYKELADKTLKYIDSLSTDEFYLELDEEMYVYIEIDPYEQHRLCPVKCIVQRKVKPSSMQYLSEKKYKIEKGNEKNHIWVEYQLGDDVILGTSKANPIEFCMSISGSRTPTDTTFYTISDITPAGLQKTQTLSTPTWTLKFTIQKNSDIRNAFTLGTSIDDLSDRVNDYSDLENIKDEIISLKRKKHVPLLGR